MHSSGISGGKRTLASYLITYDLSKPDRNYAGLYDAIKVISGSWAHIAESSWIVVANDQTSVAIRDRLKSVMDSNDKLIVCKLTGQVAWFGLSQTQTDWLKENL